MIAGAPVTAELTEQLMGRLNGVQLGQGYGEFFPFPSVFRLWES